MIGCLTTCVVAKPIVVNISELSAHVLSLIKNIKKKQALKFSEEQRSGLTHTHTQRLTSRP